MASRLVSDLSLELQKKFEKFSSLMAQQGIPFILTCTYRDQSEQDELYSRGRTKAGKKVTWVKVSKHSAKDINGKPASKAFDIAIMKDSKPTWDLKADVDEDSIPDYQEAAEIGRQVGLRAGADFNDFVHFELKEAV